MNSEPHTDRDGSAGVEPGTAEAPRRRVRKRVVGAFLLGAAAIAGGLQYLHSRGREATDDAYLEAHVIPVSPRVAGHVVRVHAADNQFVDKGALLAELDPRDFQVRLERAQAALRVAEARAGAARKSADLTRVTSGAGLDEATSGLTRAEAAVETARAQVAAADGRREAAVAQRGVAEANAEQAAAEVIAAEAEAQRGDADWKRYQDAIRNRGVSRQQLDQAGAVAKAGAARLEAARKRVSAAQAQVAEARAAERSAAEGLRQAQAQLRETVALVGQARGRLTGANGAPYQVAASTSQAAAALAEIEQARAAVRQAELELSYTRVYAPEAGKVTRKSVEAGAFVNVGQPLLALVPRDLWVVANFKETQLARMRPGHSAWIKIDAYPARRFRAHVESVQCGAGARFSLLPPENATGNFVKVVQRVPVKLVFDEVLPAQLALGPGMSVEPEVLLR